MKYALVLILLVSGMFSVSGQWVDRAKRRDSLFSVAHCWSLKSYSYYDTARSSKTMDDKVRYSLLSVKCEDSSEYYRVWSEEENVDYIKDALQLEALKMDIQMVALKPADSTVYKKLDSLYEQEKYKWITDLKKLHQ